MSYQLDSAHSAVEFAVRHMGFATVRGRFEKFEVETDVDEQGVLKSLKATIDTASINTDNAQRDEHLRSADFFDAANHPQITYESTSVQRDGNRYVINGDLTMRGTAKPVQFTADLTDHVIDPWGNPRLAAEATGDLNRTDWGLTWNQVLEAGALLVSEQVRFTLMVQMVQQVEAAA